MSRPPDVHVRQSHPKSCVAACLCMIRRWRGEDIGEDEILARMGDDRGPFPLLKTAEALLEPKPRVSTCVVSDRASRSWLRAALSSGDWAIVSIVPSPQQPLHAIILVGTNADDDFRYLDPAAPGDGQPLAMSEDEFDRQWTGEVVIVSRAE